MKWLFVNKERLIKIKWKKNPKLKLKNKKIRKVNKGLGQKYQESLSKEKHFFSKK